MMNKQDWEGSGRRLVKRTLRTYSDKEVIKHTKPPSEF